MGGFVLNTIVYRALSEDILDEWLRVKHYCI
jgi:hypothetical protein